MPTLTNALSYLSGLLKVSDTEEQCFSLQIYLLQSYPKFVYTAFLIYTW